MDPYAILGLQPGATDEAVKKAYRERAQQYSSGNYSSSGLDDIARQRMEELDAAYDQIMLGRREANAGGSGKSAPGSSGYSYTGNTQFGDIRAKINSGRLDDAETLLDGVPQIKRDAEWYFLKGTIQYKRGWFEESNRNFAKAHEMEPENYEYRQAARQAGAGRQKGFQNDTGVGCSPCSVCGSLMLADCCCSAFRCCR